MKGHLVPPMMCLAVGFALLSVGCGKEDGPLMRAVFEADWGAPLGIRVYLEGNDGRSIDAANLVVTDPEGIAMHLDYDGAKAAYTGSIFGPSSGNYHIEATSRAGNASLDLVVSILSTQPFITALADSGGNSASLGQALSASNEIGVAWKASAGATVYLLRISRAGAQALSRSSSSTFVSIPANALTAGSYAATVEAQAITGDPLLSKVPYYSASSATSASFSFDVQ